MWTVSTSVKHRMFPTSTFRPDRARLAVVTAAQPYHHGHLRPALVEAGLELARAQGPAGVVLREVARKVGVSHNAAYRHFADRDELLAEIAARGMRELSEAMQARSAAVSADLDEVSRARRTLQEVGRAYVEFALAEPGLFATAFSGWAGREREPDPRPVEETGLEGPFELLMAALDDLVRVGYLDPALRPGAEVSCWAAVHGFALLHLEGPLRGRDPAEREAALAITLDTIDRGLGAGPTASLAPVVNDR